MELKSEAQLALQYLTDDVKIDDNQFHTIVEYVIDVILSGGGEQDDRAAQELQQTNSAELKAAFNSLVYLFLESAKHNYEEIEMT